MNMLLVRAHLVKFLLLGELVQQSFDDVAQPATLAVEPADQQQVISLSQ